MALLLSTSFVYAQSFEVQLNPSMYAGGYNISCYGSSNGSINTYIMGGVAPFTFVWNTGATTKNLSNLSAGSYSVTVTSSTGNVATAQISLIQPDVFTVDLTATETAPGYHISEFGAHDGQIQSSVNGGVPPYNYLWSSGETIEAIGELTAGTYSLTVHDATNCVTTASATLIEPTALHIVSITSPKVIGNYNIGCSLPGSINLVVAGGVTPYTFEWEGGANTQNLSGLTEANSYGVIVRDESGGEVRTSITLTASPQISAQTTPFVYPNTKNTSCYNCNNGSITTTFSSGTAPYTFSWNNGATVQNPSNLAAGLYSVVITDAAGCSIEKTAILTAPEREDWTMNGNAGLNSNQFIGTTDVNDLVFKTNNIERFRLLGGGDVKITSFANNGNHFLMHDATGKIMISPTEPWLTKGNDVGVNDYLGVNNGNDLVIKVAPTANSIPTEIARLQGNGTVTIGSVLNPVNATLNGDLTLSGNLKLVSLASTIPELIEVGTNGILNHVPYPSQASLNYWTKTNNNLFYDGGSVVVGLNSIAGYTLPAKYKLFVAGSIAANEVIIKASGTTNWPDYVFDKNYLLPSLCEVEKFIKDHHHLPGMPSAGDIDENGQALANLQKLQQQKIEELQLYIIELKHEIEALSKEVKK